MATHTNILVTRPAGQAEALCEAIVAKGLTAHCLPMLQVLPLSHLGPRQQQQVRDLDSYQHLIFVSANAVRYGMDCIESCWSQLPVGPQWYAVGEGTARLLLPFGVEANTPGSTMSSEGLLALPQLQQVQGARVLIVKGEGGRRTLAEQLVRRGARVDELACYRRAAPELAPGELAAMLAQWEIELVMISSGEGLCNMLALLSPAETTKFSRITLLVPSPRVADMAITAGFEQVITAENASDSAMLRALAAWDTSAGE